MTTKNIKLCFPSVPEGSIDHTVQDKLGLKSKSLLSNSGMTEKFRKKTLR